MNLKEIANQIANCKKCDLWKSRQNAVPGEGPEDAKIMLIGESPGKEEDKLGRPFVGMCGKFLTAQLEKLNLDRKKMFICGIIKCHPPGNRKPRSDEISKCLPYTLEQIKIIKPKIICILGDVALKALLGKKYSITKDSCKIVKKDSINYLILPHPSAAMRFPKIRALFLGGLKKLKKIAKN